MSLKDAEYASEEQMRALSGMQYQRRIADRRPVDVHSLITEIQQHIQGLDDKVVGREGLAHLTEIDCLFRAFYTGRDRADFK